MDETFPIEDISATPIEALQSPKKATEMSAGKLGGTHEVLLTENDDGYDFNEHFGGDILYAKAIFDAIHLPLLILDKDLRIKKASTSFYNTFSITEDETVGKILTSLQDKQWNIPGLTNKLLSVQTGAEKFIEWEVVYTFPLIGKRTICFNARSFQKENGEHWILLAIDDITVRKDIERAATNSLEDLKKILENLPQITLTASPNGSITYFNRFFLDYSGMTFAQALKHGLEPLIKPEMLGEFKKSWSHVIGTGEDFKMELQLRRKNENTYRWHLYHASPIRTNEGSISSWVGTATDMHDQKSKEQAQDEFMTIASHELKTPLTSAKAYIQLLQLSLDQANNKDLMFAQKAGESIDRLSDLISELLDVSKIQNGKLGLNITTFNFNEMISAAIEGFQYTSPSHSIIKNGIIAREITGDKERLQQVVVNLLQNAIKYSPKANKVIINMSLKNGEIMVSVKDRGIGIEQENLWKIFERYYREGARTMHFQGLGIGLYISYDIIQRHNGKLWAQKNGGRGCTFYFTLPV